jgi:glutamate formiminotransferase/formiminotetrahydrofolate cyclodeaminase
MFKFVKAIGWYMECFEHAQVSVNLTNYRATPLSAVFDEVCRLAEERGARCIGSELIGLIPRESLLEAGRHFRHKAGKTAPVAEPELIRSAVSGLLLDTLHPFSPDKKIIEYCIQCVREI